MTRAPSLTLRLALLFAASASLVLIAVALLIRLAIDRHFVEQDLAEISGKIELVAALHGQGGGDDAALQVLRRRLDDALVGHHGLALELTRAGARIYARDGGGHRHDAAAGQLPAAASHAGDAFAAMPTAIAPAGRPQRADLATWSTAGHDYRGLRVALPATDAPLQLAIAVDIGHHRDFMRNLDRSLASAAFVGALSLALAGWWAARRGLAPLRAMAAVARGVSAQRLKTRIDLGGAPAELQEVGESVNAMLARLEEAFVRLSDFSADLAHELRTPINNLMMQTQVALSKSRSAAEYAEVLHANLEDYERLARMTSDMLFLAKAEHGLVVPQHDAVQLDLEVRELFEFFEALAEDRGVTLRLAGSCAIAGDRSMLRRALANLLANAVRHTAAGGEILVALAATDSRVRISVSNPGTAIAPELQARIFDRFVRADTARQASGEGAGLGLAITRSIVAAHGGTISASSHAGRNDFVIELPARH